MTSNTVQQEPISRSIFEEYYEFIDGLRFRSSRQKNAELLKLEKIISLCERKTQDLNSENKQVEAKKLINLYVENALSNILNFLRSYVYDDDRSSKKINAIIKAVAYHITPIVSILHRLSKEKYESLLALRYINKLGRLFPINETHSMFQEKCNVDYLLNKLHVNVYRIGDFDSFSILNVEAIDSELINSEFDESLEREFEFDEAIYNAEWLFELKFSAKRYDMAEIGYTMWTFAKALESINGLEVELIYMGEGSKIVRFKARLRELTAKVDLKDILKTFRQSIESYYFNKPYEEIRKIEAESKKLEAEAKKLEKECENLPTKKSSKIKFALEHKDRALSLYEKQLALEERELELKKKKIDYYMQATKLMENGFTKNNSKVQLMINSLLYTDSEKKLEGQIENNLDIIEANERYSVKEKFQDDDEFGTDEDYEDDPEDFDNTDDDDVEKW